MALSGSALAAADWRVRFGAHDVQSMFRITKSENSNEVHYGVRLDGSCQPRGDSPVFGYWRVNERGGALSPLTSREQSAYGVRPRQPVTHRPDGTSIIRVTLAALPGREVVVKVDRAEDGACHASAQLRIGGQRAELRRVHVQLGGLFGLSVDHLRLDGRSLRDAAAVHERVDP